MSRHENIVRMRHMLDHRIIHGYDTVDFDILWKIVTQDLPTLIKALERIVPAEESR